jgi:aminoglycoside phosphotransferase (APT) family kinase protein
VPVPRARLLCEDPAVIGTPFFVMDYLPGRVFAEAAMPGEPVEDRHAVYDDLARVLAELHRIDWRAVGLTDYGRPDGYMQRQVALWTRQWEAAKVEEMPAMDALAAWLPEHLPVDDEAACIAHGDFRLGNVILAPTDPRVMAVLDWELATIGHPLADVGYFIVYHFEQGTGIEAERDAFVSAYCRYADRPVPASLDVFVIFSLFRLASIVAGVWRRGLDGNAADARAGTDEFRDRYRQLAERGWELAQGL